METSASTASMSTEKTTSNSIIIEKDIPGKVISINKMKHYAFIRRTDNNSHQDIFARDISIIKVANKPVFFISDLCTFDIIKTSRGFEAVNIIIVKRNIDSISKFKKIPKKKNNTNRESEKRDSLELFKSTM
ncbi:unnamed protein product [Rotaria sordida]|uniref:Uncharacterized protein n=1 Tax=Rotaria sordida TaxID=392033 RepID=A0A816CI23_9BILA|nr:unnamed protein product [Rotaria sordida]CAF1624820.1 unnamed protein product [Rotaria sordida]